MTAKGLDAGGKHTPAVNSAYLCVACGRGFRRDGQDYASPELLAMWLRGLQLHGVLVSNGTCRECKEKEMAGD